MTSSATLFTLFVESWTFWLSFFLRPYVVLPSAMWTYFHLMTFRDYTIFTHFWDLGLCCCIYQRTFSSFGTFFCFNRFYRVFKWWFPPYWECLLWFLRQSALKPTWTEWYCLCTTLLSHMNILCWIRNGRQSLLTVTGNVSHFRLHVGMCWGSFAHKQQGSGIARLVPSFSLTKLLRLRWNAVLHKTLRVRLPCLGNNTTRI